MAISIYGSTDENASATSTRTLNTTIPADSSGRAALIVSTCEDEATVGSLSSCYCNGVAADYYADFCETIGSQNKNECWWFSNAKLPTLGTPTAYDFDFTWNETMSYIGAAVIILEGVHQSGPDTSSTAQASGSPLGGSITPTSSNSRVFSVANHNSTGAWSAGSSQTVTINNQSTSHAYAVGWKDVASPASTAMSWTASSFSRAANLMIAWPEYSAGSGVTASITGVSATASVGTIGATGGALAPLSGVAATSAVGVLTVSTATIAAITGVSSNALAGNISAIGHAVAMLSGVESVASVGNVTAYGGAITAITGVSAEGQIGTITAAGGASVVLTGVSADGLVGTFTIVTPGGETVTLTGVSAEAQVGTFTVNTGALVQLTGVSSNALAGTVNVNIGAIAALVGVSASAIVGVLDVTGGASVAISGVFAEAQVGTLTIDAVVPTSGDYLTRPRAVICSATNPNSLRVTLVEFNDRVYAVAYEDRVIPVGDDDREYLN